MKGSSPGSVPETRPCVLLVDDEPLLTLTLGDVLEDEGYEVLTALDGKAALHQVRRGNPDIVFLDLRMPGMSGEEVAAHILARHPRMTVVILTGQAEEEQIVRLRRMGVRDVLLKPAPIRVLLDMVARAAGQARTEYIMT